MPQKIVLPDVVFPATPGTQIIYDDALMSSGSLFLFDPAHSLGGFAGVPANGVAVPNVAWRAAAAALSSGDASTLAGVVSSNGIASGIFQVERTTKGGVHGMSTQGGSQTGEAKWAVDLPSSVRDHIYNHRSDHSFYVSVWSKLTRKATDDNTVPQSLCHFHNISSATANYLWHMGGGLSAPLAGIGYNNDPASNNVAASTGATRFASVGVNAITGLGPSSSNPVRFGVGSFGPWEPFNRNKAASIVIYRVYVEDLTISGRTYSQVNSLDYAMFVAQVRTAGGKYTGDTHSDPGVLVP